MWIHIAIFIIIAGLGAGWKLGLLPMEGFGDKKNRRLVLMVALGGNLLGLCLTLMNGSEKICGEGYRLQKDAEGSYEERFLVSVDGNDPDSMYVQIPQKETGEEEPVQEAEEITAEEKQKKELAEVLEKYNQKKDDPDYYYLPDQWEGKHYTWQTPGDTSGELFAALCLAAAMAVMVLNAREGQKETMKRYEQLLMDYPGLIMKFTLLVQAGMTVRKAFGKIGTDYRKKKGKGKRYAYEEILTACYEMDSGISEWEAYRRFGERCGQVKYKIFSTLLIQNLQKGSHHLADLLEKESVEAWEERKRKARVLGEAAATKLLLPMVMLLVVVMAIIMIPAFLSFYG